MTGVLLTLAYDGAGFVGYAKQKTGRTVQATLHEAILALDPDATEPRGASRTDSGVHAEGQLAAFDSAREMDPRNWARALNAKLPDDVAVRRVQLVPPELNPRFCAKRKRYRYRIFRDWLRDPHVRRAWSVDHGLLFSVGAMKREAASMVGTHDFAAFRTSSDERKTTERTLFRVDVTEEGSIISIVVEGNAFLHNMVRIIAGTLYGVGVGAVSAGAAERAFASRARSDLGQTAPAEGLTLEHVEIELPEGAGEPWPP